MKREASVILAAMMVIGNVSSGYAATFSDINNVPWEGAKTYINTVADLGLMVGDTDATGKKVFRAKDKVTYCETMQMTYTLLKNNNKLLDTTDLVKSYSPILTSYNIPAWAQEAVAYGLRNEILSITDVSKFMKDSKTNNNATREGVAVIFGKALAASNTVNASAVLSFSDKQSVAPTSVPYVDLLARLNILVGDTNNNFNAKSYINRAEMAVITSKTQDVLKSSTSTGGNGGTTPTNPTNSASARGTITKVDNMGGDTAMITLLTDTKNIGFVGNDTVYVVKENTTDQFKFSDLQIGDIVTVDYTGSQINKVTVNFKNLLAEAATVKGFIDEISSERVYVNKSTGGTSNYYYATNMKITLDGSDATMKQLIDAEGEGVLEVELTIDSSNKISKFVAKQSESGAITGELKDIDEDEINIKRSGSSKKYDIANDVVIKLENKDSSIKKIQNAQDDDTIYVKVYFDSRDDVSKIYASTDEFAGSGLEGSIKSISNSEISIKKSNGKTVDYDMADSVTYRLDGSSSKLSEIKDEMDDGTVHVLLTVDSKDKVTKVDASTDDEDDDDTIKGEITKITSSYVRIKKSNGDTEEIDLASDITYQFDGSSCKLTKLQDEVADDDVYGIVLLDSKGRATDIEASNDEDDLDEDDDIVKGELRDLTRNIIEIRKTTGKTQEYDLASRVTYKLNGSSSSLSEIQDELLDETVDVKATLNSDEEVTKIDATSDSDSSSTGTVKGKFRNLYKDSVSIRNDKNDKIEDYNMSSRVTYYLDGKNTGLIDIENAYDRYSDLKIILELNSSDKITKMEVFTTGSYDSTKTIKSEAVFVTDNSVKVKDGDQVYTFASSATCTLDSTSARPSDFTRALEKGYRIEVTITLVNNQVKEMVGRTYSV